MGPFQEHNLAGQSKQGQSRNEMPQEEGYSGNKHVNHRGIQGIRIQIDMVLKRDPSASFHRGLNDKYEQLSVT